jgi:AraC-like DNA-binding protein
MLTTDTFRRLCLARDLLRETHDDTVPISQVAREAVMSPFHFIRQFQAIFGETPHQFRIRARLDRAKDLLALSDYSVTDVCMEVGFSSLGSFSDLFARRVVAPLGK